MNTSPQCFTESNQIKASVKKGEEGVQGECSREPMMVTFQSRPPGSPHHPLILIFPVRTLHPGKPNFHCFDKVHTRERDFVSRGQLHKGCSTIRCSKYKHKEGPVLEMWGGLTGELFSCQGHTWCSKIKKAAAVLEMWWAPSILFLQLSCFLGLAYSTHVLILCQEQLCWHTALFWGTADCFRHGHQTHAAPEPMPESFT